MRLRMGSLFCFLLATHWLVAQPTVTRVETRGIEIISQGASVITPDGRKILEGPVTVRSPNLFLLTADEALEQADGTITARGNVKIDYQTDQGLVEITASEVHYQIDSGSGSLLNVTARFGDAFFFRGSHLEILDKGNAFIIEDGTVTACNQPIPQWSMSIKQATVEREGYARIKGAKFRLKRLPLIYLPYLVVPAMQKRRSGLLIPETGRSDRNGSSYAQPIYWAPRQDLDFTFTPTVYDRAGFQFDLESRYTPTPDFTGIFESRIYWDDIVAAAERAGNAPTEDGEAIEDLRYRFKLDHRQKLMGGHLDLLADAGSDFSIDRDYLRNTDDTRTRDYYMEGRFHKSFGRSALLLRLGQTERILSRGTDVLAVRRLPDIKFYQPNRHIGGGFFLHTTAYASQFELEDVGPSMIRDDVMRLGLETELSRTANLSSFIHTRWGAGYRGAYYRRDNQDTDSRDTNGAPYAFVETVGPRLQKDYEFGGQRLVHVLDAGVVVKLGNKDDNRFLPDIFLDELDLRINEEVDGIQTAWKVNSRFFLGSSALARPVLEVEVTQDLDVEGNNETSDPINTRFRLLNLRGFDANGIFSFNPDTGTLDTLSIYGSVNRGEWRGYGGYVKRQRPTGEDEESFIAITSWQFPRWRSRFKIAWDYDFELQDFKSQEFLYGYQGQCVGFNVVYVKSPFDSSLEANRDYLRLTVSLRNLSEFGTRF